MKPTTVTIVCKDAETLAVDVLTAHGTNEHNARSVAAAVVAAEADGLAGHGLSRLPMYAAQSKSGKVDGTAVPRIKEVAPAALRIDACDGFAYPALAAAVGTLPAHVRQAGIAMAAITRSHHFGAAGYHVEKIAAQGMVALMFGNSPKAIAPWGGSDGVFGTNPIAFAATRQHHPPLVIDLSLSRVARGKIMVAAQRNQPIPMGWALDAKGNRTTNAQAAMEGTMLPMGDAKGAVLVMMVEILAAALTGSRFGFEASSFFTVEGEPPRVGQLVVAFDPHRLSGGEFGERLETLIGVVLQQSGARLPGARRLEARQAAHENGLVVPVALHEELTRLAEA